MTVRGDPAGGGDGARRPGLDARAPLLLGLLAALALLAGGAIWSALVPVAGAIVASGEVDGTAQRHAVQHTEGGLVAAVAVREGQRVAAGDLIVRLDGALLDQEWRLIDARLQETEARARRLRAERDGLPWPDLVVPDGTGDGETPESGDADHAVVLAGGAPMPDPADAAQHRLFQARALTLARQSEQLEQRHLQAEAERDGLAEQAVALDREAALIAASLSRQRALRDRGLAPADRITALELEAAQLDGRRAALTARRAELGGEIALIALQAETLHAARREEAETQLAETTALHLELVSRRAVLAERRARLDLRAPVAGRIHALAVTTPGAVLPAGGTVAQIVPDDPGVPITLRLRPDDIDRVYPGQPATVRLPALDHMDLPELPARVREVSAAGLSDERTGARYFRATLELTVAARAALQDRALVPGMAVQGLIATGARTPLDYLLAPLRAQMHRALREP